ncbi:TetR/AcrR family transcriptional regulator [Pseudonocardia spinosispora]|uniref:TetR/AcrR family transcriptional regulator n=1 Tax=Pseudonocardia spinosispora TaxID=103441 RepID=UPI0004239AF0|nr:TetR/AcrR family transcriptional regulator [Pseudonocardia spinosispora]
MHPDRPAESPPRERADSRRKRLRLLDAARVLVAERGLDITSADLAERAEVGVGTLYRRFGSREALLQQTLLDVLDRSQDAADTALAGSAPLPDLERFLGVIVDQWVANRGLAELVARPETYRAEVYTPYIRKLRASLAEMVERAQDAGAMRPDVTWRDVLGLTQAASTAVDALGLAPAPEQGRRMLAVMLDGLTVRSGRSLPGDPPADSDLVTDDLS